MGINNVKSPSRSITNLKPENKLSLNYRDTTHTTLGTKSSMQKMIKTEKPRTPSIRKSLKDLSTKGTYMKDHLKISTRKSTNPKGSLYDIVNDQLPKSSRLNTNKKSNRILNEEE